MLSSLPNSLQQWYEKTAFNVVDNLLSVESRQLPEISTSGRALCDKSLTSSRGMSRIRDSIDAELPFLPELDTDDANPPMATSLCEFAPITLEEVSAVVRACKPKTCDCSSYQQGHTSFAGFSSHSELIRSVVTPLLKKPSLDSNELNHYKPVSNIPFLARILEKLVAKLLLDHLNTHHHQEQFQSAYRPCPSTETALIKVQHDITCTLDISECSTRPLKYICGIWHCVCHCLYI